MNRPTQRFLTVAAILCVAAGVACTAATGEAGKTAAKKAAREGAAPPTEAGGATVAVIGDRAITLQQLDAEATGSLMKVRQQEYEVRRQALDTMIDEQIMDKEASAKGLTREKLIEAEVTSKVTDPQESEVAAYYEQNKARFGSQTKEQMLPQIKTMLRSQKVGETQRDYLKSLRAKHGVKVLMEPPRVAVSIDDDPIKGPEKAPITIVEFSDYQCPYCSRAEATVQEVLKKYGDKIRFVYRDYPLNFHPNAETAAIGAQCAQEQGKFWEMHQAIFANQAKLAASDLVETAGGIGLDKEKFKSCLDTGKYKSEVQKDFQDGVKYGVSGTPTFFINGIMIVGARGADAFAEIIDQELERRN